MPEESDDLFLKVAVEQGRLSAEAAETLRQDRERLKAMGLGRTVAQLALEKGLLSVAEIAAARREMVARGEPVKLGGYELLARVGEGGMGAVYKARQRSLDRIVALKVLRRDALLNRKYVARFKREAKLAAKAPHPNAVHVYDVGKSMGRRFIVMEFVDGPSVAKALESGPMEEARALEIARGVASALEVAHEAGIIHRDIKPSNILLTASGAPKLADLGVARWTRQDGEDLTREPTAVGTPMYMPPEQCLGRNDEVDGRSDFYSLGATLYHMVCGQPPFSGDTTEVMLRQVQEAAPDPRLVRRELSPALCALIQKLMAKRREDRPQTAREVIEDIDRVMAGQPPRPVGPALDVASFAARQADARLNERAVWFGGAALLCAVALGVWAWPGRRAAPAAASKVAPAAPVAGAPAAAPVQPAPAPQPAPTEPAEPPKDTPPPAPKEEDAPAPAEPEPAPEPKPAPQPAPAAPEGGQAKDAPPAPLGGEPEAVVYIRDASGKLVRALRADVEKAGAQAQIITNPRIIYAAKRNEIAAREFTKNLALAKWCEEQGLDTEAANQAGVALYADDKDISLDVLHMALRLRKASLATLAAQRGLRAGGKDPIFNLVAQESRLLERLEEAALRGGKEYQDAIARSTAEIRRLQADLMNPYEYETVNDTRVCTQCHGAGEYLVYKGRDPDGKPIYEKGKCARCDGTGREIYTKRIRRTRDLTFQRQMIAEHKKNIEKAEAAQESYRRRKAKELANACDALLEGRAPAEPLED
ncbi:MAG TPA: protein kinase [Candidatus Brocadiia bacterium]|nr:protein kinase [Candidatus Brocadiia bacterium]